MGEIWRANDAGEPAHSAGDPILNELKSKGVSDALCVVIRYFGGTKLGVGGLVKAYGGTAKAALEDNPVREVLVTRGLRLRFPYGKTSEVNRLLQKNGWESSESCFAEDCRMALMIPQSQFERAKALFHDLGVLEGEATA